MENTRIYYVLIVGDSRLRSFAAYFENLSHNIDVTVRCIPGARIDELGLCIRASISYQADYDLIIFIGGINDVTKIKYRPIRHATLRYSSQRRICEWVMSRLRDLIARTRLISDIPVVVATLPGMSLSNYSPGAWYRLIDLQPTLDSSVVEINRQIRGLNRMNGFLTPNLAYPVHRCAGSRGRYYAHYAYLTDGLHPGDNLLQKWAQQVINYCANFFPYVQQVQEWVPPI